MRTPRAIKYLFVAMLRDAWTTLSNAPRLLTAALGAALAAIMKNKLAISISIGSISFISIGAIFIFAEPWEPPLTSIRPVTSPLPPPLPPCEQRCDERAIADSQGRQAVARYYLGNWLLSEVGRVSDSDGRPLNVEISHLPPSAALNNSQRIVTIGAASFGEECGGRANREEARAAVRANRLAELVRSVVGNTVEIRVLNLGKYGLGPDAAEQRPAIIVCILKMDPNLNVIEAILPSLNAVFTKYGRETGAIRGIDVGNFSLVSTSRIELRSPNSKIELEACAP